MTPDQKHLVQTTFQQAVPIADTVATIFYDRLFELDPSLRGLFGTDLTEQRRKLMAMLGTAVSHLHRLDVVLPQLQKLGRGHVAYGVTAASYDTVGAALIFALETVLGDAFTQQVRDAWVACYVTIATTMKAAAEYPQAVAV